MLLRVNVLYAASSSNLRNYFGLNKTNDVQCNEINITQKNNREQMLDTTSIDYVFQAWVCSQNEHFHYPGLELPSEKCNGAKEVTVVLTKFGIGLILGYRYKHITEIFDRPEYK